MASSPRIAFVAPFGLGQKTTVWARTLPLARHLVRCGFAVQVIIPPWDTPADAGQRREDAGVEIIQVPIKGGIPATVGRMVGQLNQFRPDLVHIVKPRAHAGLVQWWLWVSRGIGDWRSEIGSGHKPQSPFSALRSPLSAL